jgi:hypothetical protein
LVTEKAAKKKKPKPQTLLSGGKGDGRVRLGDTLDNFTKRWAKEMGRVGLGDTLDIGVDYWAVQNEAFGEEDNDGEILVTIVCFTESYFLREKCLVVHSHPTLVYLDQ